MTATLPGELHVYCYRMLRSVDVLQEVLIRAWRHLGYLVLGELIASCAGRSFCEFGQRELLAPLGMSRTGFEHAQAPAEIATGYWRLPHGGQTALRLLLPPGIVGQRADGLVAFRPFYVNGSPYGGLVGDVHDAARFLSLHIGEGAACGQRLLSAESTVAMRALTTKGKKLTTGLGWWRRHEADDGSGLVSEPVSGHRRAVLLCRATRVPLAPCGCTGRRA